VSGIAPPYHKLGIHINEIIFIPVLICITEDKIKGSINLLYKRMGISQAGINIIRQACLLKVLKGSLCLDSSISMGAVDYSLEWRLNFPSSPTEILFYEIGGDLLYKEEIVKLSADSLITNYKNPNLGQAAKITCIPIPD
jgi:hypothetical protein